MKHKGLIITGIVLLSVLVVGLVAVMVIGMTSGVRSLFNISPIRVSSEVIFDEQFQDITKIEILSDCGDIALQESADDGFYLTAFGERREDITVTADGGKLTVNYPAKKHLINFGAVKNNIALSLPASFDGEIKVTSAYGNVSLCSLPSAKADIRCDYGNITAGELLDAKLTNSCGNVELDKAATVKAEVDLGKITVGEITAYCNIENNCGDIHVKTLAITADSTILDDLGSITVDSAPNVRVEAETDLGKLNIRNNDEKAAVTLTITNDCGDITVK